MNAVQATKITQMLSAQTVTGAATVTANQDCKGYDYASIVVNLSASTTPSMTALPVISLLESDDTVVTNFATYIADKGVIASSARDYVYHLDMRSRKRYQRISVSPKAVGTDGTVQVGVAAILSKAELEPASTTDMVGSTNDQVSVI